MPVSEKNTNKNPWAVALYDHSLQHARLGTNKGTNGFNAPPVTQRIQQPPEQRVHRTEKKEPEKYYRHIASDTF